MSLYTVDIGELADCEIEADRITIGTRSGRSGDILMLWRGDVMVGCFTKWESVHKDGKWRVCGEADKPAKDESTEDADTQRRNERQRIIDGLPSCPFCGSRPVWHATSYEWVKCGGPDCRNRDAWYRPDKWRARAAKPAENTYTATVMTVHGEIRQGEPQRRCADCVVDATGERITGLPLPVPVWPFIICKATKVRITVETL